ncbi:amidohydrolase 2 [Aspergillus ambiguus]|uniref:amidohydrolase family protein n=1 Tax=Aspergillus ambiguus TaxID=176160 RepID=UPI003CCE4E23
MRGKVSFEEAYEIPALADSSRDQAALYIAPKDLDRYLSEIKSPTGSRFDISNKHDIGYTVYSLTVPRDQGITDKTKAEKHATDANNWIYNEIKDHRDRMGAFAALSMHDPAQAAQELERCKKAVELDVPIYLHPSAASGRFYDTFYKDRRYLIGPPLSFAQDVALHTMGLITNGVFDRHPKAKLILGHLGERIPQDLWRTNHWLEDVERPLADSRGDTMSRKPLLHYFKNNIYVTTSGHFSTETVKYVCDYFGPDRILFSVDSPYEKVELGASWYDNDKVNLTKALGGEQAYYDVGRENAKKLLKLGKYHDSDA